MRCQAGTPGPQPLRQLHSGCYPPENGTQMPIAGDDLLKRPSGEIRGGGAVGSVDTWPLACDRYRDYRRDRLRCGSPLQRAADLLLGGPESHYARWAVCGGGRPGDRGGGKRTAWNGAHGLAEGAVPGRTDAGHCPQGLQLEVPIDN